MFYNANLFLNDKIFKINEIRFANLFIYSNKIIHLLKSNFTKITVFAVFVLIASTVTAQKSIEEYIEKKDPDKIKKAFVLNGKPMTTKSFNDGHGRESFFTSKDQFPKKIALVTFNLTDLGNKSSSKANLIASKMYDQVISDLKKKFAENGAELLVPSEYLDTPEKRLFYYDEFMPEVSKLGNFLSDIESRGVLVKAGVDDFRYFDMGAALDFKRAESLGYDLAKQLGVDAVLSIGIQIGTDKKKGYLSTIKMVLHGPNPIAKEDKKYVAQKSGNGYNKGQIYVSGSFGLKKPIEIMKFNGVNVTEMNFKGLETLFAAFVEKFYSTMNAAVEKNAP